MRRVNHWIPIVLFVFALLPLRAEAFIRRPATTFATLPAGAAHPEGITVDAADNVYVTTFAVNKLGPPPALGELFVFDSNGELLRHLNVAGSSPLLLDLAFHPSTGRLLVIDFGGKQVLDVNPFTGASVPFMTLPTGFVAGAGLNALTFDSVGNVYVSDSFQGKIWRTGPTGGTATAWVTHPLLTTTGVPGFGANGLAFNRSETALFVANTGNDTVVKIPDRKSVV